MTRVTKASIAYTATQVRLQLLFQWSKLSCFIEQVRFALSSSSTFCKSDTTTDSERFYLSVMNFLDDPEEIEEVSELLDWWDR